MITITPLSSGSKGNILLLETETIKLIIDVGISAKIAEQKLQEVGVSFSDVDAILITHEHSDHIKGLETIARRYNLPVFANAETAKAILDAGIQDVQFTIFTTDESFHFKGVDIYPFSIQHDTMDPVAFTFVYQGIKVGICTDLGYVTSLVKAHLEGCHALVIESNHEPSMIHACNRPQVYKTRVLGRQGHLSNDMCCELLTAVAGETLQHVFLAHLSEECNNPELALKKGKAVLGENVNLYLAHQHTISEAVTLHPEPLKTKS